MDSIVSFVGSLKMKCDCLFFKNQSKLTCMGTFGPFSFALTIPQTYKMNGQTPKSRDPGVVVHPACSAFGERLPISFFSWKKILLNLNCWEHISTAKIAHYTAQTTASPHPTNNSAPQKYLRILLNLFLPLICSHQLIGNQRMKLRINIYLNTYYSNNQIIQHLLYIQLQHVPHDFDKELFLVV